MTRPRQRILNRAFTMIDLMIVVVTAVLAAGVLLPMLQRPHSHCGPNCVSNLKQVGTGMRMFANDNDGKYPSYASTNLAWNYFQAAGDQVSSPKVLLCPKDSRPVSGIAPLDFGAETNSTSFANSAHRNASLSYFFGVDARETEASMVLAGDRNISTMGYMLSGVLALNTNRPLSWVKQIHEDSGNVAFADGRVEQIKSKDLKSSIARYTNAMQRIILP